MRESTPSGMRPLRRGSFIHLPALAAMVCLALAGIPSARALTTVASYNFTSNSLASSDTDTNSTASLFASGTGLAAGAQFITVFGNTAYGVYSNYTPSTEALAVSGSDYFSFTVTPASGSIDYNLLNFNLEANANNISGTYTPNIVVRWSVDNFATDIGTCSTTMNAGQQTSVGGDADFSSFAPQSGPVEFRFYFFDNQDESFFTNVCVDNIALTETAVPEPSTWVDVLLSLGGLIPLANRQRFRRGS